MLDKVSRDLIRLFEMFRNVRLGNWSIPSKEDRELKDRSKCTRELARKGSESRIEMSLNESSRRVVLLWSFLKWSDSLEGFMIVLIMMGILSIQTQ